MRSLTTLTLTVLLILSAITAAPGTATATHAVEVPSKTAQTPTQLSSGDDACKPFSNEGERSDPNEDTLGWENGCWHNTSIELTREDGLNQTEMDAVVARAMARVEVVRQLEFERTVPVEVISTEEYVNQTNGTYANVSAESRLRENVKWEALLMVNESTDAIGVQQSNMNTAVGGYYSPSEERIVIVSDNQTAPKMNEITLSQELFHALQDRRFELSERFELTDTDRSTEESRNAINGLIEGDGNLVDRLYEERCDAEWDCLMPDPSQDNGGNVSLHWGMYLVKFQPYSDGPKFVNEIYENRGWEGVNAIYENPPASAEQVIHSEKYREDEPASVEFTDKSQSEWHVLESGDGSLNYASVGEAGIGSMLFYPYYDSGRDHSPIVRTSNFFNRTRVGQISSYDPIEYGNNPYSAGWDGDRIYPYVTDNSFQTGETGYVWKTVWDSENDSREFVDGYTSLLHYYGATAVEGRESTYRIQKGRQYADAYYVDRVGDTVYVVNAPTVDDLSKVWKGAAPPATESTSTESPNETDGERDETTTSVPGFTSSTVLLGLLVLGFVTRRRSA